MTVWQACGIAVASGPANPPVQQALANHYSVRAPAVQHCSAECSMLNPCKIVVSLPSHKMYILVSTHLGTGGCYCWSGCQGSRGRQPRWTVVRSSASPPMIMLRRLHNKTQPN